MVAKRVQRKTPKATAYMIPPMTRITLDRQYSKDNPNGGTEWKSRGMMQHRNFLLIYDDGHMDLMSHEDFVTEFEEV